MTDGQLPEMVDRIDGDRAAPTRVQDTWLCDASTGERLAKHRATDAVSLERAVAASDRAHATGELLALGALGRAAALERIAAEVETRGERMAHADARTTGIVLSLTRALAAIASHAFRGAATLLREGETARTLRGAGGDVEVLRLPWGPAAVIAPWNAPGAIAAHKVASALAAGCPVLLKPSEHAPHACNILAEAIEAAGLPRGAFQLVHGAGDVGARLVGDPRVRVVSFTGGLEGGLSVARACAAALKPVQLELGGNNPLVVLEDADLEATSRGIVDGLVTLNGQWCRGVGRVLVHASLEAALVARTLERLAAVRLDDARAPGVTMGPLAYEAHRARVRDAVAGLVERGGEVHAPTPMPALGGWFLAPSLVTGVASRDAEGEIFGPVATVHSFTTDEAAISMANAGPFGLAAYVFGADEARALRLARTIRAGSVKVNGVTLTSLHTDAPRPAWGASGLVDEGTRETLRFFTGARVVGVVRGRA